jgi:hypothetical protein
MTTGKRGEEVDCANDGGEGESFDTKNKTVDLLTRKKVAAAWGDNNCL